MMYSIKSTNEGYKILFTPWDMDISWGNILKNRSKNNTKPYGVSSNNNSYEMGLNPISVLRKQDPAINNLITETYTELRNDGWSDETIDKMIDGFELDIYGSGAYLRDMERWPDGSYQDPALGLSIFRQYVHERFASMDQYIEELELTENK